MSILEKTLSANDTGDTGAHMAGILIPKKVIGFFPKLATGVKNPRVPVDFVDEAGQTWTFMFIYYNNRLFGGTRNEYRLTGMTEFLRSFDLTPGDTIILKKSDGPAIDISYRRKVVSPPGTPLRLDDSGWKIISLDETS